MKHPAYDVFRIRACKSCLKDELKNKVFMRKVSLSTCPYNAWISQTISLKWAFYWQCLTGKKLGDAVMYAFLLRWAYIFAEHCIHGIGIGIGKWQSFCIIHTDETQTKQWTKTINNTYWKSKILRNCETLDYSALFTSNIPETCTSHSLNEPEHEKTKQMTCGSSEDSDLPVWSVFAMGCLYA